MINVTSSWGHFWIFFDIVHPGTWICIAGRLILAQREYVCPFHIHLQMRMVISAKGVSRGPCLSLQWRWLFRIFLFVLIMINTLAITSDTIGVSSRLIMSNTIEFILEHHFSFTRVCCRCYAAGEICNKNPTSQPLCCHSVPG